MDEKATTEIAKAIAADCLAMRVRFVNRVITNLYERALKPLDIKISQASILVLLSVRGPSSPAEVGRTLHMEKSTVSRNVGRMQKKGWLQVTGTDDSPLQVIQVTPKGRKLLAACHSGWTKAQDAARQLLGREGVASVHKLYNTLHTK